MGVKSIGERSVEEVGRWANNRVENSHLPFRRRERAMLRFRQMKTLTERPDDMNQRQKLASGDGALNDRV